MVRTVYLLRSKMESKFLVIQGIPRVYKKFLFNDDYFGFNVVNNLKTWHVHSKSVK